MGNTIPTATKLVDAITKTNSGTTTDDYADALQLECYGFNKKSLNIGNTGEDNDRDTVA